MFSLKQLFLSAYLLVELLGVASSAYSFELNIAHMNDHHSNISPVDAQIELASVPTLVELGGFSRQVALFKQAQARLPNLLKLHAGDALVGTPYFTFFHGESDAKAMNSICFDAFVIGNHEFDAGDAGLKKFLDALRAAPDCQTAVLSANIHPAKATPLNPLNGKPYLQPFVVREIGGVKVGIVGISSKNKTEHSSLPLPTTQFEDEIPAAQRAIDLLQSQGVAHIVVLSHIGYGMDLILANSLNNVDVIIGGDSHTLLGDFSKLGIHSAEGPYPTIVNNKWGKKVCVGHAWDYNKVFGLMKVVFDEQGEVESCLGQASLVIGPKLERRGQDGEWRALSDTERNAFSASLIDKPELSVVENDADFDAVMAPFSQKYKELTTQVLGKLAATESLCLIRVPGSVNFGGKICDTVSERSGGSDILQIVTESYRLSNPEQPADIGFDIAGSVRSSLETDGLHDRPVTREAIYRVSPYPNELYLLHLSGNRIREALEQGVANWRDLKNGQGSHPYASGLRWELDLTQPQGQRFTHLEVRDQATKVWQPLDPEKIYSLVTTIYLSQGFENYLAFREVCLQNDSATCVTARGAFADQTLIEYVSTLKSRGSSDGLLRRIKCEDYSHQKVITEKGKLLSTCKP